MTRQIYAGPVAIGGGAPVSIQSMLNTRTTDVEGSLRQIRQLAAGRKLKVQAIAFGDFSYYNIGDRGSRSMQELKELFAGNGMVGYVMKERVDGRLILPEAVQILKMKGTASS